MTSQFISGLAIWRKGRRISPQAFVFDAFSDRNAASPWGRRIARNRSSRDFAVVMAQTSASRDVLAFCPHIQSNRPKAPALE
jgi:hypothetical protein